MSHADSIWPALAALRSGELPSPAGVDALVALARGEVQAPPPPLLPIDGDPLAAEWSAAYEVECLAPCPTLERRERAALRSIATRIPGSQRYYGWFHRWRTAGPQWAQSVTPRPSSLAKHIDAVVAWAGPRLRAAEQAQRAAADVARAEQRPVDADAPRCEPPPGGFAALVGMLASKKGLGG